MIGRIVIKPYELPIELIVGILGSIIFIGMLLYRLRYGRKAIDIKKILFKDKEVKTDIDNGIVYDIETGEGIIEL